MQVSSAPVPAAQVQASSPLVEQVKRQAAILADGSGASDDQKIDAYAAIMKAMAQSDDAGPGGWFQQSTQAERDAVNAIMDGASMARQIRQAADAFNARGMRADRNGNVMADQIVHFNGLSPQQQKMIFVGTASPNQADTLDGWKRFMQQNADGRAAQLAAEQPAVKVTLSDGAKAALSTSKAKASGGGFQNQDRFDALIERVNNASGAYSKAEQMDAYAALHTLAVGGGLVGMGEANQKLYNQAASTSAVAMSVKRIGQGYTLAMMAGAQKGGASGARQAALDYFDKLGASDQDVLFRGHVNAADMSGSTPFADMAGWRNSMLAGVRLDQFIEKASADGKARSDPAFASALKLSETGTQNADWIRRIAELLAGKDEAPKTAAKGKVDLLA